MHETNVVEACQEIMDYSYEKCYTYFQEALAEYPDPTWIDENCEIRDPEQLERVINPGKFFRYLSANKRIFISKKAEKLEKISIR